jgi:WD40 repeat protein/serine/threonine protein kinase
MGVRAEGDESRGDDLLARLPLPLAQLYRRAMNAKSPLDRHHNAYYLAEATLKLAACARIGAALTAGLEPRSPLARALEDLTLPSVGHWVGFLRGASLFLKDRPDAALLPLAATEEKLHGPGAFPAARAFAERAARAEAGQSPAIGGEPARDAARQGILGFFALAAAYRNQVFGHGAQRLPAFYEELGPLLLAATAEVLREECLFAHLTLAVARLSPGAGGIEWQGLEGLGGLTLAESRVGAEPAASARAIAGHVYFVAPGVRVPLHPLVVYQEDRSERERVGFLNRVVMKRRGAGGERAAEEVRRVEYLDYATGDILPETEAREAMAAVLSRLRRAAVMALDVGEETGAEEPAIPSGAGEVIGDFELEGELGRGGMGIVYRARQRSLNRRVALKVLPPALAGDPVALARFRREIAALARADHPNLVKILTSGSDRDRHYYAMELVEGTSLADLQEVLGRWQSSAGRPLRESDLSPAISSTSELSVMRRKITSGTGPGVAEYGLPELERIEPGPPPSVGTGRALRDRLSTLFAQAAGALAHLHARGILHRDMKPGNLMLTADGERIVVMDLGLAQLRDRSRSLTRTGARWVGTLRYSAPEQLQSSLLDVDERADVYGLGASLYELITLSPLFDGDSEQRLIEQVLHQEPRLPRKLDPSVPRDLEAVVMGCLEKDRSRRYANARDLAEDLERFSKGLPVRVRPVTAPRRFFGWCRRNPALAVAGGLVLAAALAVVVVLGFYAAERNRNALDLQYRLAESHLIRGQALCEESEIDRGLHWMARAFEETPPAAEALRETIRTNLSRWRSRWTPPHAVVQTGASINGFALSPDDRQVAVGDLKEVSLWSVETGERLSPPSVMPGARTTSFSPDGKLLLTAGLSDTKARVWSLDHLKQGDKPQQEWNGVLAAGFDPRGKRVLTAGNDRTARVWSVETGNPLTPPMVHPAALRLARFSPEGIHVLTVCTEGTMRLWWAETGEEMHPFLKQDVPVILAEFSPDGKLLLAACNDSTARLWSVETGKLVGGAMAHQAALRVARFSPDGRRVLTGSMDKTARLWSAETGAPLFPPFEHGVEVSSAAFSPDGGLALTGGEDGNSRLWSLDTGKPVGGPIRNLPRTEDVALSHDGKWMATKSPVALKWWRVEAQELKGPRLLKDGTFWGLAFSPDGKNLLTGGETSDNVRVWSLVTGESRGEHLLHADLVWTVAWSPDGTRLVTGSRDGAVRFWSAETGAPLPPVLVHSRQVREVAYSHDGSKIATACFDSAARVWSVESGKQLCKPLQHEDIVEDVAFSPDDKSLLTGSGDRTARLWSVETGNPIGQPLVHPGSVLGVAFSPDGALFATGCRDGMARLWSAASRRPVGRFLEHPHWVEDIEFSPDGTLLLTGCSDGAARVWSVKTRQLVGPLLRQKGAANSVAFSPDGKSIALGGTSVRVWDLPPRLEGDAGQIRLWTEATTGLEMDADGVFRYLDPAAWRERQARLAGDHSSSGSAR